MDSAHTASQTSAGPPQAAPAERREITSAECFRELGYCFPNTKKWLILSVIFLLQVSMNFNTSVYPNAIEPLATFFGVPESLARAGMGGCLLAYGVGCELWAPWSEEFGRWKILAASLALVNLCQVWSLLSPNIESVIASRVVLGLSSAGGSVTLGIVADMWRPDEQQEAVAFIVFSSVFGATGGPILGGFLQDFFHWRVNFVVQLGLGVVLQVLHFFTPETRSKVLMDQIAKKRRKHPTQPGDEALYGPNEMHTGSRVSMKGVIKTWIRPFRMFLTEPIVLSLSLLSGFSDALIFTFMEGFNPVFGLWGFRAWQIGLCFLAVIGGYGLAWASFIPFIKRDAHILATKGDVLTPERRLYWLLWLAPLECIGLLLFGLAASGPPLPWIFPALAASLVGIANYAIYMATIDYMVAAYGPYAASATGGNALARDVLAGCASFYSEHMYARLGGRGASFLLSGMALMVTVPIYAFYWKGEWFRERSAFVQALGEDSQAGENEGGRRREGSVQSTVEA